MTFNEKKEIYFSTLGVPYIGISGKEFFKVISLLCRITNAYRNKTNDKTVSSFDVLTKFFQPRNELEVSIVENVSIHCDYQLCIDFVEFDDYGISSAKEAQAEIIKILSNYLPF